jgi:hypothetical protein
MASIPTGNNILTVSNIPTGNNILTVNILMDKGLMGNTLMDTDKILTVMVNTLTTAKVI